MTEDEMIARADWRQPLRPGDRPHPEFSTGYRRDRPRTGRPAPSLELEADFQQRVTDLADAHGWDWQHCRRPQEDRPGFPDLVLWHPGRGLPTVFRELKREGGKD